MLKFNQSQITTSTLENIDIQAEAQIKNRFAYNMPQQLKESICYIYMWCDIYDAKNFQKIFLIL